MAQLGLDTGAVGRGLALLQFARCGTLEVMGFTQANKCEHPAFGAREGETGVD
jgi:hypothetical protein